MTNSFFFPAEVMIRRFAVGHNLDGEKAVVADPWPIIRPGNPAGGVTSDAIDQLKYMRFHMGDGLTAKGERILTPESMRLMQTPMVPTGEGRWVGLTWSIGEYDGVKVCGHGGTTNGQESDFWFAPQLGIGLTVMTNLDRGDVAHRAAHKWANEHLLGVQPRLPETLSLTNDRLAEYNFTCLTSANDFLSIVPHDGGLCITHRLQTEDQTGALPPMHARFYDRDQFLVLDGILENARGEFLRDESGRIGWMRLGGRIQRRTK